MNNTPKLPPIIYICAALATTSYGYAVFLKRSHLSALVTNITSQKPTTAKSGFDVPATVPAGTVIKIGGATSMAQINQSLKQGFEQKYPGAQVAPSTSSSNKGLTDIATGLINIAGISRPLTDAEKAQGLK